MPLQIQAHYNPDSRNRAFDTHTIPYAFKTHVIIVMSAHIFYCTQPPHAEVTKLLCPHHEGAGSPHPIRMGGPDLWYQIALVDTTVEQSLVSSAGGTRGRECVQCVAGSQRRRHGVEGGMGEGR